MYGEITGWFLMIPLWKHFYKEGNPGNGKRCVFDKRRREPIDR
jgi:hypothetical protein